MLASSLKYNTNALNEINVTIENWRSEENDRAVNRGYNIISIKIIQDKSVLPDPVLANPIRSLPDKAMGRACACMEVGFSNPTLLISFTNNAGRHDVSNDVIGRGVEDPDTLTSSSSRRTETSISDIDDISAFSL